MDVSYKNFSVINKLCRWMTNERLRSYKWIKYKLNNKNVMGKWTINVNYQKFNFKQNRAFYNLQSALKYFMIIIRLLQSELLALMYYWIIPITDSILKLESFKH